MVAIANLLQTSYHRAYIMCFHFIKLSTSDNCHDKVATATIVGIGRGQESWMLCASVVIFSIWYFLSISHCFDVTGKESPIPREWWLWWWRGRWSEATILVAFMLLYFDLYSDILLAFLFCGSIRKHVSEFSNVSM